AMSAKLDPFPCPAEPPSLSAGGRLAAGILAARSLRASCRRARAGGSPVGGREAHEDSGGLVPACVASPESHPELELSAGVFITLYNDDALRGCIGMVERSEPLRASVPRLTCAAASRDIRFPPVNAQEIPRLRIEITLLGCMSLLPPEPERLLAGVDPAEHGLRVKLGERSAILLPKVARRFGWGTRELLEQVSRKAGLDLDAWRDPRADVSAFTAWSFEVSSSGEPLPAGPPSQPGDEKVPRG
ncbi:MAG TPA: AmmeMemoRadiSam system protein A, partial [Planctomycetota bacterium]|nr:AmmeMemoRadiSam system protein A [Planctomycetota bacterium]